MKRYYQIFLLVSLLVVQSCTTVQLIPAEVYHKSYPVINNQKSDSSILMMLSPYKDSVNKTMNKVIGFATETLTKSNDQVTLGNFFTDAMKETGEKHFGRKIDVAVVNVGGMRSYIPKGDITVGKIYELMPFDNLLVLQEVKGSLLKQFLDHTASAGGWPLNGVTMTIKNKRAENVLIGGKPLDENATYVLANSDYVANGGDNTEMLKQVRQINIGYLMRDALIEYVQQFTKNGKPVTANKEIRITNAD
jgi:2',3'-cyclic-nucleotide 2'-phosphodiesterase (5'-nucleotidase family)